MGVRINGVWHEELADPETGGSDSGNGRNYTSSSDYSAATGGTQMGNVNTTASGGTAAGGATGGGAGSALDAQYQKMLSALASGNREAFDFEKQKFNQQFEESKRQYDQGRDDSLAQFAKSFGLDEAAITGMYNGQQTEGARQFDINASQTAARDQANLGTSLLNSATQLRGPKDYLQYQEFTRGGQNLMQQLYGDQAIPQGAAPTGQLQSANLQNAVGDLGWNPGGGQQQSPGGGYAAAPGVQGGAGSPALAGGAPYVLNGQIVREAPGPNGVQYIQMGPAPAGMANYTPVSGQAPQQQQQGNPAAQLLNRFGLSQGGSQQLQPNQIDPARWDAMGQIGQDLTKNLAETQYGYDATDFENQINKTRPIGTASRTTRSTYATPRGLY